MAQTQINGGTQIRSGTITTTQLASAAGVTDGQLATSYIKADGTRAFTGSVSYGGFEVTSVGTPTTGTSAANKSYVDAAIQGFDWKQSVRAATTTNGTLASAYANGSVIDGVTLVTGDRILLKAQTTGADDGIYTVNATGAPTRAVDADSSAKVTSGLATFVSEGSTLGNSAWLLTTDDPITLGTTSLVFTQIGGGSGSVSTVSVVSANGFTGTVANATSTPAITLTTSITGVLKGNGTAISAATAGTDYYAPGSTDVAVTDGGTGASTLTGIVKGNGTSAFTAATAGTDYMVPGGFVIRETPSGTVNGSNTSFTLAYTPVSGTESAFQNGILMEPGAGNDYTISGSAITWLTAPATGDKLRVSYHK